MMVDDVGWEFPNVPRVPQNVMHRVPRPVQPVAIDEPTPAPAAGQRRKPLGGKRERIDFAGEAGNEAGGSDRSSEAGPGTRCCCWAKGPGK